MYAKLVRAANFMGAVSLQHELGQVTLITGDNMLGKTRISRAVQLAIGGFLPICNRQNSAIIDELGNGAPLSVCVDFDAGQSISRHYKKERSAGKCAVRAVGLPDDFAVPAVLITADEYFGLSARERTDYLFSVMGLSAATFNIDELTAAIKNIKLAENTPESEAVIREICDELIYTYEARTDPSLSAPKPLQQWIEELSEHLAEKQTEANAAVKRMDGTTKGLVELSAQSTQPPISASVEGELAEARKQLTEAQAVLRTLNNAKQDLQRKFSRKVELEMALSRTRTGGKPELQAKIEPLQKKLLEYRPNNHEEFRVAANATRIAIAKKQTEKEMLDQQVLQLDKEHAKIFTSPHCPTCDAEGTDWRDRVEKKHRLAQKLITDKIAAIVTDLAQFQVTLSKSLLTLSEYEQQRIAHDSAGRELLDVQRQISAIDQEESVASRLKGELDGLTGVTSITVHDEAIVKAMMEQDAALASVAKLEQKNQQLISQRSQIQAQAQAVEQGKRNMAELAVTKEALKVVLAAKEKLTEQTIGALLRIANAIAGPILDRPLVYRDGEIGWHLETFDRRQSHRTFSGTERGIAFAALSIALAAQSPIKIAFMDEMGIMHVERRVKLVELAKQLIEQKIIHQFIGNDTTAQPYQHIEGVTRIALAK